MSFLLRIFLIVCQFVPVLLFCHTCKHGHSYVNESPRIITLW